MSKPTPNSVTPFNFGDHAVRVVQNDHAQPWFVVADVAEALGYKSVKDAQRAVEPDEKGSHIVRTLGGQQRMTTVNEAGLYALILRSRKPAARAFSRWVRGEVLPSLRKTGQYIANSKQNKPIPGIQAAQSAHKKIAHDPASLIGKGLPPLPAGLEFPSDVRKQIDQAVLQQAMALMPALRSYLERRVAYTARNAQGWLPALVAPSIAQACLRDALNYEATSQLRGLAVTACAIQSATARLHTDIQAALKAAGLATSGLSRIV